VNGPSRVVFTAHAARRAQKRGIDLLAVADLVVEHHTRRRRNPREADWLIRTRRLVIAYNWPDRDDRTTAVVVSMW
jgi:hypothetical protein